MTYKVQSSNIPLDEKNTYVVDLLK